MPKAIVIKSTGSQYLLKNEKGEKITAILRGKFKNKGIKNTNPVAVGDEVIYEETPDVAAITEIFPRKNYLIRKSVNLSKQNHIIASNIDQALVLFTLKNPSTKLGFLDRFLLTCEAYEIEPCIVFNKYDLYSKSEQTEIENIQNIYEKIGYQTIKVSSKTSFNMGHLIEILRDKTSMFFGHSGSGKSTLINCLQPDLNLKTKDISDANSKGQHTTTFAEMYDWDFGGNIIDTPGVKEFGLIDIDQEELQDYFPEIFALKPECKFYNCIHINEPKCAVKEAIEHGDIAFSRYQNYSNLIEEINE